MLARSEALVLPRPAIIRGRYTKDAQAIYYKIPIGFFGVVNRTHPASIEPVLPDPTNPPTYFGQAGVIDVTSHKFRTVLAGDTGLSDIYGVTVRPFPFQEQHSIGNPGFGATPVGNPSPSSLNVIDVLRLGYIMVALNNFAVAPSAKGGAVFVWVAATITNHVQGSFEAQATSGSTIALPSAVTFNGPPDANGSGIVELAYYG